MDIQRRVNENDFEWKLRLAKLKLIDKIDLDWEEIVKILGINCSGDHLRKVSYGLIEYDTYLKNNGVATRILSISDSHVPFNLPIEIFKDYIGRIDILQLNGDILDMQSISKFPKSYRVSVMDEIILGRQYIIDLIEYIKPKKVSANYGNHELRFQNYLSKNLDSDLLELMPKTALDLIFEDGFNHYDKRNKAKTWYESLNKVFSDIEIEYTGNWFSQIGKTIFCHPSAFTSGILKTSEKATNWFRNEGYDFDALVMAHTHRVGDFKIGNTIIFEQGACCDTKKQHYSDGHLTYSQKEGFICVCQDENGKIKDSKTELVRLN